MNIVTKQRITLNPCEFGDEPSSTARARSRGRGHLPSTNGTSKLPKTRRKPKRKSLLFNPELYELTSRPVTRAENFATNSKDVSSRSLDKPSSSGPVELPKLRRKSKSTPDNIHEMKAEKLVISPRILLRKLSEASSGDEVSKRIIPLLRKLSSSSAQSSGRESGSEKKVVKNPDSSSPDLKRSKIIGSPDRTALPCCEDAVDSPVRKLLRRLSSDSTKGDAHEQDKKIGANTEVTPNNKKLIRKLSSFSQLHKDEEDNTNIMCLTPEEGSLSRRLRKLAAGHRTGSMSDDEDVRPSPHRKSTTKQMQRRSSCGGEILSDTTVNMTKNLHNSGSFESKSSHDVAAEQVSKTPDDATSRRLLRKLSSFTRTDSSDDEVHSKANYDFATRSPRVSQSPRATRGEISQLSSNRNETDDEHHDESGHRSQSRKLNRQKSSFDFEDDPDSIEAFSTPEANVNTNKSRSMLSSSERSREYGEGDRSRRNSRRLLRKLSSFTKTDSVDRGIEKGYSDGDEDNEKDFTDLPMHLNFSDEDSGQCECDVKPITATYANKSPQPRSRKSRRHSSVSVKDGIRVSASEGSKRSSWFSNSDSGADHKYTKQFSDIAEEVLGSTSNHEGMSGNESYSPTTKKNLLSNLQRRNGYVSNPTVSFEEESSKDQLQAAFPAAVRKVCLIRHFTRRSRKSQQDLNKEMEIADVVDQLEKDEEEELMKRVKNLST